jgi:hypothetical protein
MVFLSTGPAHATDPEQSVTATVTGQSVSLTVSPTTIDYGVVPFETSRPSTASADGNISFLITNTGNVSETFNVRGTSATGTGATWTLVPGAFSCPNSLNTFRHSVTPAGGSQIFLTTANQALATSITPAGTKSFTSEIYMPCFGSDGATTLMTTNIVVSASNP